MLPSNEAALDAIIEAIEKAGYGPGDDLAIALDVAASELRGAFNRRFDKADLVDESFVAGLLGGEDLPAGTRFEAVDFYLVSGRNR